MNSDSALNKKEDLPMIESDAQLFENFRGDNNSPWVSKGNLLYSEKVSITDGQNQAKSNEKRFISDGVQSSRNQNSSTERNKPIEDVRISTKHLKKKDWWRRLNERLLSSITFWKGPKHNTKQGIRFKTTRELKVLSGYMNERKALYKSTKRSGSSFECSGKMNLLNKINNLYMKVLIYLSSVLGTIIFIIYNWMLTTNNLKDGESIEEYMIWVECLLVALYILEFVVEFNKYSKINFFTSLNGIYYVIINVLGALPVLSVFIFELSSKQFLFFNFLRIFRVEKLIFIAKKEFFYFGTGLHRIEYSSVYEYEFIEATKELLEDYRSNDNHLDSFLEAKLKLNHTLFHFFRCLMFFSAAFFLYFSILYPNNHLTDDSEIIFLIMSVLLFKNPGFDVFIDDFFALGLLLSAFTTFVCGLVKIILEDDEIELAQPKYVLCNFNHKTLFQHIIIIGDFSLNDFANIISSFIGDNDKNSKTSLLPTILFLNLKPIRSDLKEFLEKKQLLNFVRLEFLKANDCNWPLKYNFSQAVSLFYFTRRKQYKKSGLLKILFDSRAAKITASSEQELINSLHQEEKFLMHLELAQKQLNPYLDSNIIIHQRGNSKASKGLRYYPTAFKQFDVNYHRERVLAMEIIYTGFISFLSHLSMPKEMLTAEAPRNTWFLNKNYGTDIMSAKIPEALINLKFSQAGKVLYLCSGSSIKGKSQVMAPVILIGVERFVKRRKSLRSSKARSSGPSIHTGKFKPSSSIGYEDLLQSLVGAKEMTVNNESSFYEKKFLYFPIDITLKKSDSLVFISKDSKAKTFVEGFSQVNMANYKNLREDLLTLVSLRDSFLKGVFKEILVNIKNNKFNYKIERLAREESDVSTFTLNNINDLRTSHKVTFKMKNHVILFGWIEDQGRIAKILRKEYEFDNPILYFFEETPSQEVIDDMQKLLDVYIFIGEPTNEVHLMKLNVDNCKAIVLSTYHKKSDKKVLAISRLIFEKYPNARLIFDIKDSSTLSLFLARPAELVMKNHKKLWPLMVSSCVTSDSLWENIFVKQATHPFYKMFLRECLKAASKLDPANAMESNGEIEVNNLNDFNESNCHIYTILISDSCVAAFHNVGNLVFYINEVSDNEFILPMWIHKGGAYEVDHNFFSLFDEPYVSALYEKSTDDLKKEIFEGSKVEFSMFEKVEMAKWNQNLVYSAIALDTVICAGDQLVIFGNLDDIIEKEVTTFEKPIDKTNTLSNFKKTVLHTHTIPESFEDYSIDLNEKKKLFSSTQRSEMQKFQALSKFKHIYNDKSAIKSRIMLKKELIRALQYEVKALRAYDDYNRMVDKITEKISN